MLIAGFGEKVSGKRACDAKTALWKRCLGAAASAEESHDSAEESNIVAIIWRFDDCVVVDEIRG